jgi:hypothetical protein
MVFMVAVKVTVWPLTVPVMAIAPLLQMAVLFAEGTIENTTCPVTEPFCWSRKPPCVGLPTKEEGLPCAGVIVNCQLPASGPLCCELELLLPQDDRKAVRAASNKTHKHLASAREVQYRDLCAGVCA